MIFPENRRPFFRSSDVTSEAQSELRNYPSDISGRRSVVKYHQVSDRTETKIAAQAVQGKYRITARQHALQSRRVDLDAGEARSGRDVLQRRRKSLDLRHGLERLRVINAAGFRDADQIGHRGRVADLPASFAIGFVIQHDDRE